MNIARKKIEQKFSKFGVNKLREIERLVNEISKIENKSIECVLNEIKDSDYGIVKKKLLNQRYPKNYAKVPLNSFYLPQYDISENCKADLTSMEFEPKNIYYDRESKNSFLFSKFKNLFPNAKATEIVSLKEFIKKEGFSIPAFNNRCENVFLIKEKYDFFKKCPCSCGAVECGYNIMNLGMGCPYECVYCFLQGYQNIAGIILPSNIEDYLCNDKIFANSQNFFKLKRIGSGEWTDSLVFDDITNFSKPIVSFFKEHSDIFFEFKTKSVNINNLLSSGGKENIVVSWSVNALKIQKENEFKTADILKRLNAAAFCVKAGFSVAFHFDPIVLFENWKEEYKEVVDMIFDIVNSESIKWISLGTLRMPADLKQVIENRFPQNEILNEELLLNGEHKLRYCEEERIEIYKFMFDIIKRKKTKAVIYPCMETPKIWNFLTQQIQF